MISLPIRKQIYTEGGYMQDKDYIKSTIWITLIISCILIWYSIFTNGLFVTVMWLIVIGAIIGIIIRVWETRI